MALFHITIVQDKKALAEINRKLDRLLADLEVDPVIKKAASDLDTSTNELKEAVKKNTPSQSKK